MAARASQSRGARPHPSRLDEDRARSRERTWSSTDRSIGAHPDRVDPAPALRASRAYGILGGLHLDISEVPTRITVGYPVTDEIVSLFEAFAKRGVFEAIEPKPNEAANSYLFRAFAELDKAYQGPFEVALDVVPTRREGKTPVYVATISNGGTSVIDIGDAHQELLFIDPHAARALMDRLVVASKYTFYTHGPQEAYELSLWHRFNGEPAEWWQCLKDEIVDERLHDRDEERSTANVKREMAKITNLDVRKFIRSNDLPTPGRLRQKFGRVHAQYPALKKTDDEIRAAFANASDDAKRVVDAFLIAAQELTPIATRLEKIQARNVYILDNEGSLFPGLIIETTFDESVLEIMREFEQYNLESDGMGPSFSVVVEQTTAGTRRIVETLDLLASAASVINRLALTIESLERE